MARGWPAFLIARRNSTRPSLYKLVRHPLYIGWLIIFWAAPTMTVAHLVFALATTAYILIAIQLEERDLVDGVRRRLCRSTASRTPMLIPRLWPGRRSAKNETSRSYN